MSVDISKDESRFSHFGREGGHVCVEAVVHRDPREELANDRKRRVLCRDKAAYLRHDSHQCGGADVSTLATHVTARDDLEPTLLSTVDVIRNVPIEVDLLSDRMSSPLDRQRISEFRPSVAPNGDKVSERAQLRQGIVSMCLSDHNRAHTISNIASPSEVRKSTAICPRICSVRE